MGGFGSALAEELFDRKLTPDLLRLGVPDKLVDHASPDQSKAELGLRSEEHTSELQSLTNLVCRLLLEKKKSKKKQQQNERKASYRVRMTTTPKLL